MKQTIECEQERVEDIPISAVLGAERPNRYGSVPGLDDEELADPAELERQVHRQEWGPVLRLPVRSGGNWIQPNYDEDGGVDWGAFGTVDFDRYRPAFDKARYKVECLRERLTWTVLMLGTVRRRLPRRAMYRVLKYVRMGVIEWEHIASEDMRQMVRLQRRAEAIRREIAELQEFRQRRRAARQEAWLEA